MFECIRGRKGQASRLDLYSCANMAAPGWVIFEEEVGLVVGPLPAFGKGGDQGLFKELCLYSVWCSEK